MRTSIPAPKAEKTSQKLENTPRKKLLTKAPVKQSITCIVLGILVIAVPFILYAKTKADVAALQEKKCIGQIQPEVYEMGEEVPVLNSMVKITTVKEMTMWQKNVPEGFSILAENYECNEAIEVEKLHELNLYLKITDGEHVNPLSSS